MGEDHVSIETMQSTVHTSRDADVARSVRSRNWVFVVACVTAACSSAFKAESSGNSRAGAGGARAVGGAAGAAPFSGGTGGVASSGGAGAGSAGAGSAGAGSAGAGSAGAGGATCRTLELLTDGGFDDGAHAWTQQSAQGLTLIRPWNDPELANDGVTPDTLYDLALLGKANFEVAILSQPVTIPDWAVSLTLTGKIIVQSVDDPSVPYDHAFAEFASGSPLIAWSNATRFDMWTPFETAFDATALRGQSLVFRLRATTDDGAFTNFFFDTLSLVASSCSAP